MSESQATAPVAPHPPYEVLGVLGRGAVATVYRVRDPDGDRPLAWKVWQAPFDAATRARFEAECTLHTALSEHPHIVRLIGRAAPSAGERPWIATELHEQSLHQWLEEHRPTPTQWRTLADHVLAGLAAVHAAGHVHRDVKPANVLLRDGKWSLTDLGLALPIGTETVNAPAGTPFFVAPELGRPGVQPTLRSDVYSVAVMLTLLSDELQDAGGVPPAVDAVLTRAASVHPDDRPVDAGDLRRRLLAAWPEAATEALPTPRRSRRVGAVAALVACGVLLAGSIAWTSVSGGSVECSTMGEPDALTHVEPAVLQEVSHLGYTVDGHISAEVAGRLTEAGQEFAEGELWVLSFPQASPVGLDGRPGNETWYPLGQVRADDDGCFETAALQVSSYDGAQGIVFRMALATLAPAEQEQAGEWLAQNSSDGWRELPAGVRLLDSFDVDSGPFENL